MSETGLHKRIEELESENHALRTENKRLREALGLPIEDIIQKQAAEKENTTPEIVSATNKYSPSDEKIKLFMSLFRGRTDVYAKRCYSRNFNSSYYIPACKNEWIKGLCDRSRVKCKNCKNRELLPLEESVINAHLRNKDDNGNGIVGIYPLLPDDSCLFLAVDFDEEEWPEEQKCNFLCKFYYLCNGVKLG